MKVFDSDFEFSLLHIHKHFSSPFNNLCRIAYENNLHLKQKEMFI